MSAPATARANTAGPSAGHRGSAESGPMSHREVLVAMSGLLLGMFVAILAGTVVSTSLPRIIADLGGDQAGYTWVVTASLLATTVTTPIWGKFADLMDRKLLIQLSLVVFVIGSALCGFAQTTGMLIGFRVLQGLGSGGMMALVQIVMADIVSPRDRGKYMGLIGAVMAVGTVGGPLLGGMLTDLANWRWNFYVALPVAVLAIVVLQKTLRVPARSAGRVTVDYLGTALLAGGVSLLLIWVSLAGNEFDWLSVTSGVMVGGSVLLLAALVLVERRASEPIIPMALFRSRTFTMTVIASVSVGVAMFGTTIYLSQYMQLARGASATESGLMTFPMVAGLMVASAVAGALISRRGHWKIYMVTGSALMIVGLVLMGTIRYDTAFPLVALYMIVLGSGVGMVMQNLVLIVQNDVRPQQIGVASSGVSFFRTLGGTIGVSAMGAVLGSRVISLLTERRDDLMAAVAASGDAGRAAAAELATGNVPDMADLPPAVARVVESVYGDGIAELFWVAVPLGLIALAAVALLPNKPLGRKTTAQRLAAGEGTDDKSVVEAVVEAVDDAVGETVTSAFGETVVEADGDAVSDAVGGPATADAAPPVPVRR